MLPSRPFQSTYHPNECFLQIYEKLFLIKEANGNLKKKKEANRKIHIDFTITQLLFACAVE